MKLFECENRVMGRRDSHSNLMHTFRSLADEIDIRSSVQQLAGGVKTRSPSFLLAFRVDGIDTSRAEPDGRGMEQQETFARYNEREVPG